MPYRRNPDRLYNLLPAIYRKLDASEDFRLRALLRIVNEQADLVKADIEQLWENFFIETCDRWVIPYIGDLVSNNALHATDRLETPDVARDLFPDLIGRDLRPPIAVRTRADVAKTIYYRRRKGTLPMLEELARDVTGWAAHAVEFFELLEWNQNLNHLRPHSQDCADLKRVEVAQRVDGAFDTFAHTVDVRQIDQVEGWYNIRNVGFFLWRLGSYALENVPARVADAPWRFHFSPLGNPAPLFSRWLREGDERGTTTELHVPGPIRPAMFFEDLKSYRALTSPPDRLPLTNLYGSFDQEKSLSVSIDGTEVHPALDPSAPPEVFQPQIVCRRLDPWPATRPSGFVVAIDVASGRLALGQDWGDPSALSVDTSHHFGFSADLGGGTYPRGRWLLQTDLTSVVYRVKEDGTVSPGIDPPTHTSVAAALTTWEAAGRPNALIQILDSRTYQLPESTDIADGGWLVVEAADRQRPMLQTAPTGWTLGNLPTAGTDRRPELTLSGVVIEGFLNLEGDFGRLRLLHMTLVPGRTLDGSGDPTTTDPSVVVASGTDADPVNTSLRVEISFSITGPLRLPYHAQGLWLLDSIVDGILDASGHGIAIAATGSADQPAVPATIIRATIFGASFFKTLILASETIFSDTVAVQQKQTGCVRFSYMPPQSRTPRRYRCQPELEVAERIEEFGRLRSASLSAAETSAVRAEVHRWLVPTFTDLAYGLPGYAQLRLSAPIAVRTGAEDGAEMGVFCHLKQPQRETNLQIRIEEYLPFGLESAQIYVT